MSCKEIRKIICIENHMAGESTRYPYMCFQLKVVVDDCRGMVA